MPSTTTATARLEARISPELHALLKRAAALQDRTLTDFVIAAVQDAAQRAIEQAEVLRLSAADQARFAQALLVPPPAAPALERAFARRRAMVVPERAKGHCGSRPSIRHGTVAHLPVAPRRLTATFISRSRRTSVDA